MGDCPDYSGNYCTPSLCTALPVYGNFHRESGDYVTVGFGVRAPPFWANPSSPEIIEFALPKYSRLALA